MTLSQMPYPPSTTAAIFGTFAVIVLAVAIGTWLVDRHLKRTYARRQVEKKAAREQREASGDLSEL